MSQEPESQDLLRGLEGVDFSRLDKGKEDQYPTIQPNEISEAFERNPMQGRLMRIANESLRIARAQAEGQTTRERGFHDMGWSLSLDTSRGMIGLWSCWLGNQFYLGYPKSILRPGRQETDELIMKVLDVERARAVRQVNATGLTDLRYKDEFADEDKPLEQNEYGQILGYKNAGMRLWARFYGSIEPTGGRVWVDSSDSHSNSSHFSYIDEQGQLQSLYYGHEMSNGVYTHQFSYFNQYAPEGPTDNPEAIQKYKDRFINLAAEVAFIMGGARAVNIDYGFVLVPEDLDREGYENVQFLKGDWGQRKGWGEEVVRGQKGDSTVVLKSGNSMVPWSTILRAPVSDRISNPAMLADFIRENILWF